MLDITYKAIYHRAEAWLVAHFPDSLRGFADRFLTRAIWAGTAQALADLAKLQERSDLLLEVCQIQAEAGELYHDMNSVLALAWSWQRLKMPQHSILCGVIEPTVKMMAIEAQTWPEPTRSAFFFGAGSLGILPLHQPGVTPMEPLNGTYHDLHLLMYASDYGRQPLSRRQYQDVLRRLDSFYEVPQILDNPDLCAERLLIEKMLMPSDSLVGGLFAQKLAQQQQADGGFGIDGIDSHNHTVSVAATALGWWLFS